MRTLADFIYDLAQNSVRAGSRTIEVVVREDRGENLVRLSISDDGGGIRKENLEAVRSPFFTTRPRNLRTVGLGLSLMDAACERAGGELKIESEFRRGTTLLATMEHDNVDRPPVGDLADLFASLLMSTSENGILWTLEHNIDEKGYVLKNRRVMDELNILSFREPGVKDKLQELIAWKERELCKSQGS